MALKKLSAATLSNDKFLPARKTHKSHQQLYGTTAIRLPVKAVEIINTCPYRQCRNLAAVVLRLVREKQHVNLGSNFMRQVTTAKRYGAFLGLMKSLSGFVGRNDFYIPKSFETKRVRARSKAWEKGDHIRACSVSYSFPVSLSDFERIKKIGDAQKLPSDVQDVLCSLAAFDGVLDDSHVQDVLDSFPDGDQRDAIEDSVKRFKAGDRTGRIDGGGRVNSCVSSLKREVRRKMYFENVLPDGEVVKERGAEVDATCCHFWFAAMIFAPPHEKKRLIKMMVARTFYESFGDDRAKAKKELLTSLFLRRSKCPAWQKFKQLFPETANNIESVRDSGRKIFDGYVSKNGRKRHKRTYAGQQEMSRILCRAESEVFNRAIARLWRDHGYGLARIHDAILCRESQVETVKKYLAESFCHFWGTSAPVETKVYE